MPYVNGSTQKRQNELHHLNTSLNFREFNSINSRATLIVAVNDTTSISANDFTNPSTTPSSNLSLLSVCYASLNLITNAHRFECQLPEFNRAIRSCTSFRRRLLADCPIDLPIQSQPIISKPTSNQFPSNCGQLQALAIAH